VPAAVQREEPVQAVRDEFTGFLVTTSRSSSVGSARRTRHAELSENDAHELLRQVHSIAGVLRL
jgi:hypothetical protein